MAEDRFLIARASRALVLTSELGALLDSLIDEGLDEVERAKLQLARLSSTFKHIERLGRGSHRPPARYGRAIGDDESQPERPA